jgi:AcrR family transcriptional regulator
LGNAAEFPFDDPRLSLSPTAKRLLAAGRAIIAADGLRELTVKRVTDRADENLASVHYHFGNKAGLISALLDTHTYDASIEFIERARDVPVGPTRTDVWLDGMLEIVHDDESFTAFFEMLPYALREPALHDVLAALYTWYREAHLAVLSPAGGTPRAEALTVLILAAIDGFAVQRAISPEVDLQGAMDLLKEIAQKLDQAP